MIVIDTSVALKWAFQEPGHPEALALLDLTDLRLAPDILLPELCYVLRKKRLRGEATADQARVALAGIAAQIDRLVPSRDIVTIAYSLSEKLNHSAYDCFFLAVALNCGVLITADQVFARKCEDNGYDAFIFPLGETIPTLIGKVATLEAAPDLSLEARRRSLA